jgi:radical SAM superfamily enzyme YgiQ (UPF0313 family)
MPQDTKINIFSSQYGNIFGDNQIHFPYSIASLVAYCEKDPTIKESYFFKKVFLFRDSVEQDIEKAKEADILLCSCYCWNWEITKILAQKVKEQNKNCLVIFGGPEIPKNSKTFFEEHDYVDIVVHGEGEIVLHNILQRFLEGIELENLNVKGTQTKYNIAEPQERIKDLNIIPSPYTDELMWRLSDKNPKINYIASWETNRGCPFACTFCDWGSATMSKIRNFSNEKLYKEIQWFGDNKIIYVDCCDGNFGIFKDRDYALSQELARIKKVTGYPQRIGLTWVKTSSEKIMPAAKALSESGQLRAVSLSVQSLDKNVLKAVKRANIKFDKFENLVKVFADEGIQSYTELIMGLPEETLETYKNNWEILAAIHPQPSIMTWNCSVFVNAPMNNPQYKEKYGIEVFKSPMFMQHSSKKQEEIKEYEKMVRSTTSLPSGKINEVYLYNWVMMVFNSFGILRQISRFYNREYGLSYTRFHELLIDYCCNTDGIFGNEYKKAQTHALNGYEGGGWDHYDDELGDISWPIEEASWLRLTRDKSTLKEEINQFLSFINSSIEHPPKQAIIEDLLSFQIFSLNFATDRQNDEIDKIFKKDWISYFSTIDTNNTTLKDEICHLYKKTKVKHAEIILWGYESIWFGRRSGLYKTKLTEMKTRTL